MVKNKPVELPGIKNITISGRIGTGKSTLAKRLAQYLGWDVLGGGEIIRRFTKEQGLHIRDTRKRPDDFDILLEERIKKTLSTQKNHIVEGHLAAFDAQGIDGVFKILVVCRRMEKKKLL